MSSKLKKYIIRPVRKLMGYLLLRSFIFLGPFVPRKFLLRWHGYVAKCAYLLSKKTQQTIIHNLTIAFGQEVEKGTYFDIGKRVFVSIAKSNTDYVLFSKLKTREQFSRYFRFEGEEYLKAAYEKGRGVLCLVPHTTTLEFSAIMPPVMGYKTNGVSSRIHFEPLNKLMINFRESRGMANIIHNHSFNILVERLKKGECLIIMIDQDSMNIRGEFIPFFGKDAYTPIGCARLAIATGAAVVPMYTFRNDADDTYVFRILPEIPFVQKETEAETITYNTKKHNEAIEQIISQHPDQWVWMHRRWLTTPDSLRQFLEKKKKSKE